MSRRLLALLLTALVAGGLLAGAPSRAEVVDDRPVVPNNPDPAFLPGVPGDECVSETPQEAAFYGAGERYLDPETGESLCKRIRFAFGPIPVKPGQNETLIEPVDIEKPAYDGYIVRFKPDLVRVADGSTPSVETLHLHHATWLNLGSSYGEGPFFAAGEEKTIATFPDGYGMAVKGRDLWGLLYMVHNALPTTEMVWITYDIDYVAAADAERLDIRPVKPLWLDVQKHRIHPDAPSTSSYPVFNSHREFGTPDPETGNLTCRWPDDNCARFDSYSNATPNQGVDYSSQIDGTDWTVTADMAGTIIGLGGHLHFGGLRDEVSLVRGGVEKDIFISDAVYWDYDPATTNRAGAPPVSWNLSMTVTGTPGGWAVDIEPGDTIRINAVYDSEMASWYENMGIVVALVAPDPHDEPGNPYAHGHVDVFDQAVALDRGVSSAYGAIIPEGDWHQIVKPDGSVTGWRPSPCTPNLDPSAGPLRLCLRGIPTHGSMPESLNARGCGMPGQDPCQPLPDKDGPVVDEIVSAAFTYGNADMGVIGAAGIPRLVKGQPAKFWNMDSPARIWHTFTRCKEPCTGATGVNYPTPNGGTGAMDFDSMNIGFGLPWESPKSQLGGDGERYDLTFAQNAAYWEFTPTETGTFTFFCRIHPGMRGAFKVIEPEAA